MDVIFSDCVVNDKTVEIIGKFTCSLLEIKDGVGGRYGIYEQILAQIATKVANEYLKAHKMELTNEIKLKDLVDAIQLKIIEGYSLQQGR